MHERHQPRALRGSGFSRDLFQVIPKQPHFHRSSPWRDPVADYETVARELALYGRGLADRVQLVVASKTDALDDPSRLSRLRGMCRRRAIPFLGVSAVTGEGIRELVGTIGRLLPGETGV